MNMIQFRTACEGKHEEHWTEELWKELHEISELEASLVSKFSLSQPFRTKKLEIQAQENKEAKDRGKTAFGKRCIRKGTEKEIQLTRDLECDFSIASFKSDVSSKNRLPLDRNQEINNIKKKTVATCIGVRNISIPTKNGIVEDGTSAASYKRSKETSKSITRTCSSGRNNNSTLTMKSKTRKINSARLNPLNEIEHFNSSSKITPEEQNESATPAVENSEEHAEYRVLTVSYPTEASRAVSKPAEPSEIHNTQHAWTFTKEEENEILLQAHRRFSMPLSTREQCDDPTIISYATFENNILPQKKKHQRCRSYNNGNVDSKDNDSSSLAQDSSVSKLSSPCPSLNSTSLLHQHNGTNGADLYINDIVHSHDGSYANSSFCTTSTATKYSEQKYYPCSTSKKSRGSIDSKHQHSNVEACIEQYQENRSITPLALPEQKRSDPNIRILDASQKEGNMENTRTKIIDIASRPLHQQALFGDHKPTNLDSLQENNAPTNLSLSVSTIKSRTTVNSHASSSPIPRQVAISTNQNDGGRSKSLSRGSSSNVTITSSSSGDSTAYSSFASVSVDRSKRYEESIEDLQKELEETKTSLDKTDALLSPNR